MSPSCLFPEVLLCVVLGFGEVDSTVGALDSIETSPLVSAFAAVEAALLRGIVYRVFSRRGRRNGEKVVQ